MSAKVCVIGVDAMEPKLITDWMEDATLVSLANLRRNGIWGYVENPPRLYSGASWPNFYTGAGPGRHGQYLRTRFSPFTYRHRPDRPAVDRMEAFWLRPEWRQRHVAAINVPYCPLADIHGIQIADWGLHDRHELPVRTHPPPLAQQIVSEFGDNRSVRCDSGVRTEKELQELRDQLVERVRRKASMAAHYLAGDNWDLFINVFDETHCAGHMFWHLHDKSGARYDARMAEVLGNVVKIVYSEVDRAIAQIQKSLDDETTLIFLSSHGMGPAYDGNSVLPEILRRLGGLPRRRVNAGGSPKHPLDSLRKAYRLSPDSIKWLFSPLKRRYGWDRLKANELAERSESAAFWIPTNDQWGGIRFNKANREANGMVGNGIPEDILIKTLTEDLKQLKDAATGEPVVDEVITPGAAYSDYDGDGPDLVVRWRKADFLEVESPKTGKLSTRPGRGRTGDHDKNMLGMFVATGPLPPDNEPSAVKIEDFAPTISRLLGIDLKETEGIHIAGFPEKAH